MKASRLSRLALLVALLSVTAACGRPARVASGGVADGRNAAERLAAPYVVLISFDGFAWNLMERHRAPSFERVAREGARAQRMIPTFPTKTFPTHYGIATGMYAESHGLVGNHFWDPDLAAAYSLADRAAVEDGRWYRGEPIWVTAERQGMIAASFFFVGSEAPVGGVQPTYWRRFDASISREERVDQVLAWLAMEPERRPHMITLYFEDVDAVAHTHGMDAPETAEAVAGVDAALGRLLDGLEGLEHGSDVYLVLVSDHGLMAAPMEATDRIDLSRFPGVRLAESGPYASLFVEAGGPERVVAVRDSLQAMLPLASVWLREDVPDRLHYRADPRIGDIVVLAAPGRTVRPAGMDVRSTYTHGWDNETPEMGGIFIVRGPGISPGQSIAAFEAVHVYPFLAHVLGLSPNPDADGDLAVLEPILR
jgi:predicted AlkP superfamily pyrophosphatase or phosphodiesterase